MCTPDDQGKFVIDRLAFGRYAVYGSKEEEQYQDPGHFSIIDPPRVTISAEQPVGTVVVTFGPKAGLISGTVRNAVTGSRWSPICCSDARTIPGPFPVR